MLYTERFLRSKENKYCRFWSWLVGGTLINQILESAASIEKRKILNSMFFAIANSKKCCLIKRN
jgi:aspartokinase/homoserine dehydrogenase 1